MKNSVLKLLAVFLILSLAFVSLGCTDSSDYSESNEANDESSSSTNQEDNQPDLEILEYNDERGEYGNLVIAGQAKAHKDFSYAEVKVKFYDQNDAVLGTSMDNINDLEKGEVWNFEVMYLGTNEEEVASYKISPGTSW